MLYTCRSTIICIIYLSSCDSLNMSMGVCITAINGKDIAVVSISYGRVENDVF